MSNILSYLPFIVILCAMVTIHEFGHFIVAKWLGIPAEVFSVGFGPRLFGFNWGGTDFRISALPLGGYVKFRGENLEMIQGKSEGTVEEFLSHAGWKRFLVALAGPAFNVITALAIPMVGIMMGFHESAIHSAPTIVGSVRENSPAQRAGLQPGDRVVDSNGLQNPKFDDFRTDVMMRAGEDIPMTIERNGQRINITIQPSATGDQKQGQIGIEPYLKDLRVMNLKSDSIGAKAGLQEGDRIVGINGQPLMATSKTIKTMEENNGKEISLDINRGGQTIAVKATPTVTKDDPFGLGIAAGDVVFVQEKNPVTALSYAWDVNWRMLKSTVLAFKQIFAGRMSARDTVAGPIGMAKITSDVFQAAGWAGTIQLMGFLSMSLGVMNLLPIPVLDGGMIVMIFVEGLLGLIGMTLSMNIRERVQQVGFAALLLLMGFVFYNDIARLFETKKPPSPPAAEAPAPAPSK